MPRVLNVLFLCTGNSARSILAEATLAAVGEGRFRAFSAGSHPTGAVSSMVLEFLRERGLPAHGARSKSWDEFAAPGAPKMDLVITVCDSAAGEACPVWPGHPATAHWGVKDPAARSADPKAARELIEEVFDTLRGRIEWLAALPVEELDHATLERKVRAMAP